MVTIEIFRIDQVSRASRKKQEPQKYVRAPPTIFTDMICLMFLRGRIGQGVAVLEDFLVQMRLEGQSLNALGVLRTPSPVGRQDGIDGMNDPVVAHDIGGIGCATGMIVELTNQSTVHVGFAEFSSGVDTMATEGFKHTIEFVRKQILRDNVGLDDFFRQDTIEPFNGTVGRSKDGKGSVPHEEFGTVGLIDGVLEGIKIVVFLNVGGLFVLEGGKVTIGDAGTFHVAQGVQNILVALFRQVVGVRDLVMRRHCQGGGR